MGGIVATEADSPRSSELPTRKPVKSRQRIRAGCDRRRLPLTDSAQDFSSTSDESLVSSVGDGGNYYSDQDSESTTSTHRDPPKLIHRPVRKIAPYIKNENANSKKSFSSLVGSSESNKYCSQSLEPEPYKEKGSSLHQSNILVSVSSKSTQVLEYSSEISLDSKSVTMEVESLNPIVVDEATSVDILEKNPINKESVNSICSQECKEIKKNSFTTTKENEISEIKFKIHKSDLDNSSLHRSKSTENMLKENKKTIHHNSFTSRACSVKADIKASVSEESNIRKEQIELPKSSEKRSYKSKLKQEQLHLSKNQGAHDNTVASSLLMKPSERQKNSQDVFNKLQREKRNQSNSKNNDTLEVGVQSTRIFGSDKCIQTLGIKQSEESIQTIKLNTCTNTCERIDSSSESLIIQSKELNTDSSINILTKSKLSCNMETESKCIIPKCPSILHQTDASKKTMMLDVTICPTTESSKPLKEKQHRVLVKAYTTSSEIRNFFKTSSLNDISPSNSLKSSIRNTSSSKPKSYEVSFCEEEEQKHKLRVGYHVPTSQGKKDYLSKMSRNEEFEKRDLVNKSCITNRPCKKLSCTVKFGVLPYKTMSTTLVPCTCENCACNFITSSEHICCTHSQAYLQSDRSMSECYCRTSPLECLCNEESDQLCPHCIEAQCDCCSEMNEDKIQPENTVKVKLSLENNEGENVSDVHYQQRSNEESTKQSRGITTQRQWSIEKLPYQCHQNYKDLVNELEHELKIRNENFQKITNNSSISQNNSNCGSTCRKNSIIYNSHKPSDSVATANSFKEITTKASPLYKTKKDTDLLMKHKVFTTEGKKYNSNVIYKHREMDQRNTKNKTEKFRQGGLVEQTVTKFNCNKDCWSEK